MIVCLCFQIKSQELEDLSKKQIDDFLRQIEYVESCQGCLELLKQNAKEE